MDETVIVVMVKDRETGFLEKELGCYKIDRLDKYIYNTFATDMGDKYIITLKLCCDRDLSDWEFNAVYDYFDTETLMAFVTSIHEEEDCYNPTWVVTFDFIDNPKTMENQISKILNAFHNELSSVYEVISEKKDDYIK